MCKLFPDFWRISNSCVDEEREGVSYEEYFYRTLGY